MAFSWHAIRTQPVPCSHQGPMLLRLLLASDRAWQGTRAGPFLPCAGLFQWAVFVLGCSTGLGKTSYEPLCCPVLLHPFLPLTYVSLASHSEALQLTCKPSLLYPLQDQRGFVNPSWCQHSGRSELPYSVV